MVYCFKTRNTFIGVTICICFFKVFFREGSNTSYKKKITSHSNDNNNIVCIFQWMDVCNN